MKTLLLGLLVIGLTVGAFIDPDLLYPVKLLALNIMTFLFLMYLGIYIHELGHVIAAKLVRFKVSHVDIGDGRELFRFDVLGVPFVITNNFKGGATFLVKVDKHFLKLRYFVFTLGGILLQFCVVVILITYTRNGGEEFMLSESVPVISLFVISNVSVIFINLIPRRYKFNGIDIPSDGLSLLKSFFLKEKDFGSLLLVDKLLESYKYFEKGEYDLAEKGYEEVAKEIPSLIEVKINLSLIYLRKIKLKKAEETLLSAIDEGNNEEHGANIFNSLAWICLLSFDSRRLDDADKYSKMAYKLDPDSNAIIGTRGATLILLGEYEQGIHLMNKISDIDKPIDLDSNNASNFIFLGYAHSLSGDREAGFQYFEYAAKYFDQFEPDEKYVYETLTNRIK